MDLCILSGVAPGVQSGVGDYSFLLSEELSKTHKVSLVVPQGPDIQAAFPIYRFQNTWSGPGSTEIQRLIEKLGPQVVLVQYVPQIYGWMGANPALAFLLLALKKKGFDLITVAHEFSVPFEWPLKILTLAAAHRILFRTIVRASSQIVTTTSYCLDLFQKRFPNHKSSFHYIPIPSTIRVFPLEEPSRSSFRSEMGIGRNELLVTTFGFPIGEAFPILKAALSRLHKSYPDVRFLFLGELGDRLKSSFLDTPALKERVIAPGSLSEERVSNYLSASDLFLAFYPDGASTRRTTLMAGLAHGIPTISNLGILTDPSWLLPEQCSC